MTSRDTVGIWTALHIREVAAANPYGKTVRAVCTSGRRKGLTARPPPTLHLSHEANATLTPLGGRVHAAARPGRTPQGPRDPGGFRRTRAAPGDRAGTPPPIIWTAGRPWGSGRILPEYSPRWRAWGVCPGMPGLPVNRRPAPGARCR